LTTLFEPETRRNDVKRRLLLLDGHGSHLTARFVAFCIGKSIDLVVLPAHTSHLLQPLDVGVFSPLKGLYRPRSRLRKEVVEARELLRVRRERRKGKRLAIKGKFIFDTQEILELVKEAQAEASKKKRAARAITPEIEAEKEEDIEEDISEGESDCIVVASSGLRSR